MQSLVTAEVEQSTGKAAEHLQLLRALSDELERGMQAIARNALADFEESITNQQILSARLSKLADDVSTPLSSGNAPGRHHSQTHSQDHSQDHSQTHSLGRSSENDGLMQQIRAASATLQKLNLRYSILIQHSSRSAALMASLFRSLHGNFQEASGPGSKYQTWSCRI